MEDTSPKKDELEPAVTVVSHTASESDTDRLTNLDRDPYNEDETELRFLHSKPSCFIIVGKPGSGKTALAHRLAAEWRCECINPTDLLSEQIELQTEQGKKCLEMLLRGESVPEDVITQIIQDKVNSPEVAHHGYVLDGFPSQCESSLSIKDQLELVKSWKLKPDFIINVKIPDKDLEIRRCNQKVDSLTGEIYTKDVYAPEKPDKPEKKPSEEEEEEIEEEEDEELEDSIDEAEEVIQELSPDILERLVTRPEDLPSQVTENIQNYKNNVLRIYEDYMADHDQQYLIELDGNQTIAVLFKQLLSRLNCFVLRPAAVPVRLNDPEEEDIPEDVETDELMRLLGPRHMVAPRFRWKRSRWLRSCPVALYEGNVVPGKPEFAVGFLDKVYCLSSAEALDKFLKNPRPYLLPPQPRPPCKISVLGPPLSGKTTLSHLLAHKYGAKVLDMDKLSQSRLAEQKEANLEEVRVSAIETAIQTVKAKIKERLDAEAAAREAEEAATSDTAGDVSEAEEKEGDEDDKGDNLEKLDEEAETTTETEKDESSTDAEGGDKPTAPTSEPEKTDEPPKPSPLEEVDANHPDVVALVEAAVEAASKQPVMLAPEVLLEILEQAVQDTEEEMRKEAKDGPLHGGWILDNFPNTREQWNVLIESGFLPDEVVYLRDSSEGGSYLTKRWYLQNKEDIDERVKLRLEAEEKERIRLAEEKRLKEEEDRRAAEEAARIAAEEERQRRLEAGEDLSEDDGEKDEDAETEQETEQKTEVAEVEPAPQEDKSGSDISEPIQDEVKVPEGPEVDVFRETRKQFDKDFPNIQATIIGSTGIDPIMVDIDDRKEEDLLEESVNNIERQFNYQGWEYSGIDVDEEEEDLEADQEGEEEEEAMEEEEDPNRSRKKPLGDTNHFCPVALAQSGVLYPGNPEIAARYREKVYYLSTGEAREKFLANPKDFLPPNYAHKAPPPRFLMLGPRGAGKSVHGRHLAKKLGIFHISFKEKLQEMIIGKTKRRIGPEYDDEVEEETPEEEEEEEEERAIIGPDGTPFDERQPAGELFKQDTDISESKTEETEVELTDEEEAIKANLETDEPLSAEILDSIVPEWWNREPFKSTGFILEGFPRTGEEARYMAELGLFPDSAIVLQVDDTDVIGRLLPPKLDRWRIKRDKREAKKAKKREKAKKKRDEAIQKRREELTKEREEKLAEKKAQQAERDSEAGSDYEDEELEEEVEEEEDIEAILAEEFEEEEAEEEEEEELEEDAMDRLKNDLEEFYDVDTNKLATVQETLDELLIPRVEIEGGRKPHIVRYTLTKRLKPLIEFRSSMFERVYPISERLAKKMLQFGYKQPSCFGKWCPVILKDGECMQPMSGPGYKTYPCIYRQQVYYMSSPEARDSFMLDPISYINQPRPKPVVPIRMAIIGPPKSGKTALAMRFADEYGLLRLSIGEAMRIVLEKQSNSELAQQMTAHLKKGRVIPDELAVQALEICLLDIKSQTRGYILDGYPQTKRQVELLTERSIIPVRIVELMVDNKEVMIRGTADRNSNDRIFPLHDSAKILLTRLQAFKSHVTEVREWYQKEHMNYKLVDGERSKWQVWNCALHVGKESVKQIQVYLEKTQDGKAAPISNLCVTPNEFLVRMGDFGQYCPVSLANGELVDCSTNPTLEFAAEYRGHYYKMAGQTELDIFLADPEKYVPPLAPRQLPPPELLPRRRQAKEVPVSQRIELQGYCPVTFLAGKCRYESIQPGSEEFIVEYRDKYFYLESEDKLNTFMRLPEKYCDLKLPHKLPPRKQEMVTTNLPMLGYLEQTTATLLTKALTAVGCFKPKYPFLSTSRSALLYVAYYLKAFNPNNSDYVRKKYRQKLMRFEDTCNLITYLGDTMTVRYKEPAERPKDFDTKLETFFALRGIEPTQTWVA